MRLVLGLPLLLLAYLQGPDELPPLHDPGATEVAASVTEQHASVPAGQQELAYCVVIENKRGGMVRIIDPPAQFLLSRPGVDLGTVERPASHVAPRAQPFLTAARPQSVALSAVDRIELNLGQTADGALGLTLLPADSPPEAAVDESLGIRDDAIYLSLRGGYGLFGGAYPLIPGNPASVHRPTGAVSLSAESTGLEAGDILVIEVRRPTAWPLALILENRRDGAAALSWPDGRPGGFATVAAPATALAAFPGASLCLPGAICRTGSCGLSLNLAPSTSGAGLSIVCSGLMLMEGAPPEAERGAYCQLTGRGGQQLEGAPPLGEGYLYPQSGHEPAAKLPQLKLSVKLGAVDEWITLTGILGPEELVRVTALRLDWVPTEGVLELNPTAPISPQEVGPADLPSFR